MIDYKKKYLKYKKKYINLKGGNFWKNLDGDIIIPSIENLNYLHLYKNKDLDYVKKVGIITNSKQNSEPSYLHMSNLEKKKQLKSMRN